MKLVGSDVVRAVSDTENILVPESRILNRFPVVLPFDPMDKANRSPVAVVEDGGAQDKCNNDPVPAVPVKEVAAEPTLRSVPVVCVLNESVLMSTRLPVVKVLELTESWALGLVVPIPTLPWTINPSVGAVAALKLLPIEAPPLTYNLEFTVVVPIPILPVEVMTVADEPPFTCKVCTGEDTPIPSLLVVLSQ